VSTRRDDELNELLAGEVELLETADSVGAVLRQAEIDPAFQRRLATELMAERARVIEARRLRWWRRLGGWRPVRPRLAIGFGAAAAVAATVALLVAVLVRPPLQARTPVAVIATAAVAGLASVGPASTITIDFNSPMDRAAVVRALRLSPTTAVATAWRGNRLLVTAAHGFTPNSPYVLTIDHSLARTASGSSLAADVHVVFGTAAVAPAGTAPGPASGLSLTSVAAAAAGSEAIITNDGAVIATAGTTQAGQGVLSGLIRFQGQYFERLGSATQAICVSQSGRSLAYLLGSGADARIVMAAGDGSGGQPVSVPVDAGSPLGWIGDSQVSFVSGGHLEAVDRAGNLRSLSGGGIDAAHDTVVISPGGRYVFVRGAGQGGSTPGQGHLLDLVRHSAHALTGIIGDPAFSADGATVAWVDGSHPTPWLDSAPSGGGPLLSVRLPLAAGDQVTDLAVAPGGGRLAYSVTHAGGAGGELRIADLSDGVTLAASDAGRGGSPNWSPTGDRLAVLGHPGGQPEIQVAAVPEASADRAVQGSIIAFANAQITGDTGALMALSDHGVPVSDLPKPGRVVVVQVVPAGPALWRASLRLVVDPSPADPVARAADETLVLRRDSGSGRILVANASAAALGNLSNGPHVVSVGPGSQPGTLAVTFDADIDASSVRTANMVRAADGTLLPVRSGYDPSTRTVTISLPAGAGGPVKLFVATGLRDIAGHHLSAPFQAGLTIAPG
jgi:hypothetical protein